jgi:hypothetical protein
LGRTSERQHDDQAIPVCSTVLVDGLGDSKHSATFLFDVDCCVYVSVYFCTAMRTCPSSIGQGEILVIFLAESTPFTGWKPFINHNKLLFLLGKLIGQKGF